MMTVGANVTIMMSAGLEGKTMNAVLDVADAVNETLVAHPVVLLLSVVLLLLRAAYPCLNGSGKLVGGMCMLQGTNSTQRCRLSRLVSLTVSTYA